MKEYKRYGITFLLLLGFLLWGIRVANLNASNKDDTRYMEMGQEFYYGNLAIKAERAMLLSAEEYERVMGVSFDGNREDRIICIQFSVRNDSEESVSWDNVFSVMGIGFECLTWASSYDPYMGAPINRFSESELTSGAGQELWFVTTVSKSCFRDKTWNRMEDEDFYYVMATYPGAVRVRMQFDMEARN